MPDTEVNKPTLADYVFAHGITCEILEDRGIEYDKDEKRWEHRSYVVKLHNGKRSITTPWTQGMGITATPDQEPATVLDSLISDAWSADGVSFEDWAADFGYEPDSHKAEAVFKACKRTVAPLIRFLGGRFEFDRLATEYERM